MRRSEPIGMRRRGDREERQQGGTPTPTTGGHTPTRSGVIVLSVFLHEAVCTYLIFTSPVFSVPLFLGNDSLDCQGHWHHTCAAPFLFFCQSEKTGQSLIFVWSSLVRLLSIFSLLVLGPSLSAGVFFFVFTTTVRFERCTQHPWQQPLRQLERLREWGGLYAVVQWILAGIHCYLLCSSVCTYLL